MRTSAGPVRVFLAGIGTAIGLVLTVVSLIGVIQGFSGATWGLVLGNIVFLAGGLIAIHGLIRENSKLRGQAIEEPFAVIPSPSARMPMARGSVEVPVSLMVRFIGGEVGQGCSARIVRRADDLFPANDGTEIILTWNGSDDSEIDMHCDGSWERLNVGAFVVDDRAVGFRTRGIGKQTVVHYVPGSGGTWARFDWTISIRCKNPASHATFRLSMLGNLIDRGYLFVQTRALPIDRPKPDLKAPKNLKECFQVAGLLP